MTRVGRGVARLPVLARSRIERGESEIAALEAHIVARTDLIGAGARRSAAPRARTATSARPTRVGGVEVAAQARVAPRVVCLARPKRILSVLVADEALERRTLAARTGAVGNARTERGAEKGRPRALRAVVRPRHADAVAPNALACGFQRGVPRAHVRGWTIVRAALVRLRRSHSGQTERACHRRDRE